MSEIKKNGFQQLNTRAEEYPLKNIFKKQKASAKMIFLASF